MRDTLRITVRDGMVEAMEGTQPPTPAATRKRPRSSPIASDLRAELGAALARERPESIAARADVSLATVLRARDGHPVSPLVSAALARAVNGPLSPAVAA